MRMSACTRYRCLLGAIGEGDIGLHFPPSDPQWKDYDSAHFLIKSIEKLHEQGGKLRNIDATLICERPKLGEYRDKMRENVAKLCGIDTKRVNIKATTTENSVLQAAKRASPRRRS